MDTGCVPIMSSSTPDCPCRPNARNCVCKPRTNTVPITVRVPIAEHPKYIALQQENQILKQKNTELQKEVDQRWDAFYAVMRERDDSQKACNAAIEDAKTQCIPHVFHALATTYPFPILNLDASQDVLHDYLEKHKGEKSEELAIIRRAWGAVGTVFDYFKDHGMTPAYTRGETIHVNVEELSQLGVGISPAFEQGESPWKSGESSAKRFPFRILTRGWTYRGKMIAPPVVKYTGHLK